MLWEDCAQEEARLATWEEKLSDDEDQALATHFRKGKKVKENHTLEKFPNFQKGKRDYSKLKCFCCDMMGHLVRDCPLIKEVKERKKIRSHHAHIVEVDEPISKRERK